jgi:hypothetical protein
LGAELAGNGFDAKNQEKKIEAIEGPAQKRGQKGMALGAGQLFEGFEKKHWRENSRTARRSPSDRVAETKKQYNCCNEHLASCILCGVVLPGFAGLGKMPIEERR